MADEKSIDKYTVKGKEVKLQSVQDINSLDVTISPSIKIESREPSDNSVELTSGFETGGWFYDNQLRDPLTSVRLYSNSVPKIDKNGKITEWQQAGENVTDYNALLLSAILTEDFNFDASNSWDDTGSDELARFLNGAKQLAPYAKVLSTTLKNIREDNARLDKEIADGKKAGATSEQVANSEKAAKLKGTFINKAATWVGDNFGGMIEDFGNIGQGAFVTQGAAFTTYGGTGINFSGLGMRLTLLPSWENGVWITVIQKILKILPYAVGELEDIPWEKLEESVNKTAENVSNATNVDIVGGLTKAQRSAMYQKAKEELNKYLKWQRPPGGFMADEPLNIDKVFPGTLCLEIGTQYKIDNLVISNVSIQLSKQVVKNPEYFMLGFSSNEEEALSPLYGEINLLLRPATRYSLSKLTEFVYGNKGRRDTVASNMLSNLTSLKDKIKGSDEEEE